ncbi:SAICAR synthase-like protein [Lentinula lateritia]|nr:SAICAR synthase-like protein [Lentinula lateritia]
MSFSQVGGHPNSIQLTEDGSLLIKPALPLEHEFYTLMAQARAMDTMGLAGDFYGTLREENIDNTSNAMADAESVARNKSSRQHLVLSNLLHSFTKPNVLDLKLGTVLYDELDVECSEAKKARMIKTARETTSGVCGVRITGFQVRHFSKQLTPIITTKSYGKSLKKDQLPEGMRRVFPVLAYTSSTASSNVPYSAFKQPRTDLGLPPDLLLPILRSIHTSLTHLHSIMKEVELRMVGGSLLVLWEGNEQRAREGVDEYLDSDDDDEGDTSSDEDDENSHRRKPSAPYALSLIDFAHTRFVPGQGPDLGVLLGLDTFAKLIEGRILEVEDIEVGGQGSR